MSHKGGGGVRGGLTFVTKKVVFLNEGFPKICKLKMFFGIQTLIFKSATTPDSGGFVDGFSGNGFISSAIIYAVFAVASWFSPSVVAFKGILHNVSCFVILSTFALKVGSGVIKY